MRQTVKTFLDARFWIKPDPLRKREEEKNWCWLFLKNQRLVFSQKAQFSYSSCFRWRDDWQGKRRWLERVREKVWNGWKLKPGRRERNLNFSICDNSVSLMVCLNLWKRVEAVTVASLTAWVISKAWQGQGGDNLKERESNKSLRNKGILKARKKE